MKNIILPIFGALVLISCSIDINGKKGQDIIQNFDSSDVSIAKEIRNVSDFDNIEVSSAFNVIVTDNNFSGKIEVSAPEFAMEKIVTKVENGTLKIYVNSSINMRNGEKLEISFPHRKLRNIQLSGASKLVANHAIKVEKLAIDLTGASNLDLNIISNVLMLESSGASKFSVRGNVQTFDADISGASKLEADNLKAAKIKLDASGASKAKVWAVDELLVEASGASNVIYKSQNGLKKSIEKSGASKISEL